MLVEYYPICNLFFRSGSFLCTLQARRWLPLTLKNKNYSHSRTCLLTEFLQIPTPKFSNPTKSSPLFPSLSLSTASCCSFSQFVSRLQCTAAQYTALRVSSMSFVVWHPFMSNTTRFRDTQKRHRQTESERKNKQETGTEIEAEQRPDKGRQ